MERDACIVPALTLLGFREALPGKGLYEAPSFNVSVFAPSETRHRWAVVDGATHRYWRYEKPGYVLRRVATLLETRSNDTESGTT